MSIGPLTPAACADLVVRVRLSQLGPMSHSRLVGNKLMQVLQRAILWLLLVAGLLACWFGYSVISTANRAEHSLQATRVATLVVEQYVREYRQWPGSWKELEAVSVSHGGFYKWPQHAPAIRNYVAIDFSATVEELASKQAHEFAAIKPELPVYAGYDLYFDYLLQALQELEEKKRIEGYRGYYQQND